MATIAAAETTHIFWDFLGYCIGPESFQFQHRFTSAGMSMATNQQKQTKQEGGQVVLD